MDVEEIKLTLKDLLAPPPVMPWREFADWIRMGDNHDIVWGWIRNGYAPKKALEVGRTLPFWHVIEDHYTAKGYSTRDFERHIIGLINDRYLKRGYAI